MDKIQHFYLQRIIDVHGVSGTGIVARGVVLPSGSCVMEWLSFHSSICIYKNIDDIKQIHGHGGATLVTMGDPPETPIKKKKKT